MSVVISITLREGKDDEIIQVLKDEVNKNNRSALIRQWYYKAKEQESIPQLLLRVIKQNKEILETLKDGS